MSRDSISSAPVTQLLALVRASLWQSGVDLAPFRGAEVDWDEIARLAMQQTVGGLMINAALSLPEVLRPEDQWQAKGRSFLRCNSLTHLLLDGCAAQAYSKLKQAGIPALLLKGQAYARAYPEAMLRQCGDIDLYIGQENFMRAIEASKHFGWTPKEKYAMSEKHYGCKLRGVDIELHRIAGLLPRRKSDMKFRQWSRRILSDTQNTVVINGEHIRVPSPLFNVIFVFLHLYHHFISGGIGLRHVCDWTILLHKHYNEIDEVELEGLLKDFGLYRAWRTFTPIAVDYLGLPEKECPFYSPAYMEKAKKILSLIITEGNFGCLKRKSFKRPKGYLAGKIYSFLNYSRLLWRKFKIDPCNCLTIYRRYIYEGTHKVFSDLVKKRDSK